MKGYTSKLCASSVYIIICTFVISIYNHSFRVLVHIKCGYSMDPCKKVYNDVRWNFVYFFHKESLYGI